MHWSRKPYRMCSTLWFCSKPSPFHAHMHSHTLPLHWERVHYECLRQANERLTHSHCKWCATVRIHIDAVWRMSHVAVHRFQSFRAIKMHPSIVAAETAITFLSIFIRVQFSLSRRKNYIERVDDIRFNILFHFISFRREFAFDCTCTAALQRPLKNTFGRLVDDDDDTCHVFTNWQFI